MVMIIEWPADDGRLDIEAYRAIAEHITDLQRRLDAAEALNREAAEVVRRTANILDTAPHVWLQDKRAITHATLTPLVRAARSFLQKIETQTGESDG